MVQIRIGQNQNHSVCSLGFLLDLTRSFNIKTKQAQSTQRKHIKPTKSNINTQSTKSTPADTCCMTNPKQKNNTIDTRNANSKLNKNKANTFKANSDPNTCHALHDKTRTVTLEGDVFDPSGTISGGSRNNLGTTLGKLSELTGASAELEVKEIRLSKIASKVDGMSSMSKKFGKLSDDLELAEAELAGVVKNLSQTSYGMISDKYDGMKCEVDEATKEFQAMEQEKAAKWTLYNELKEREAELTRQREEKLKEFDFAVENAKKLANEKAKEAREAEGKSETLLFELESLKTELIAAEEAVIAADKTLKDAKEAEGDMQMKVGEIKGLYDEAKDQLDAVEQQIEACSAELKALSKEKGLLTKKAESAELAGKCYLLNCKRWPRTKLRLRRPLAACSRNFPGSKARKKHLACNEGIMTSSQLIRPK